MSFALSMRMRSFEILSNVVEADVDVIPVCEDMLTMVSKKKKKKPNEGTAAGSLIERLIT